MEILDLIEAAEFLKINAEVLRRKAKAQQIPSRKVGKEWRFVKEHLADWVSGRYPQQGRELRVIDGGKQQEAICQSNNVVKVKSGLLTSPCQKVNDCAKALALPTKNKLKNCTTK
jgi:excisionase family DNA binding protein